jgi:hypothetical protein
MAIREGGCLCRAVRFSLSADPFVTAVCHCTHCQKQSGSVMSAVLAIPEGAYAQTGETRAYADRGDSGGRVMREFCPACGSPILSRVEASPGVVYVKIGALDDPSSVTPAVEVYVDHAAPWLAAVPGAQRFPQAPG